MNFNKAIIVCKPSSLEAPKDQENPQVEECPSCKRGMWVSDKKRKIRKNYPQALIICMLCGLKIEKGRRDLGIPPSEFIDLNKIN